jgi:hypothetical protein
MFPHGICEDVLRSQHTRQAGLFGSLLAGS